LVYCTKKNLATLVDILAREYKRATLEKSAPKFSIRFFRQRDQTTVEFYGRAARWPKIQTWVNFGGSCNGLCWHVLWPFGTYIYFVAIWKILWPFGAFANVWSFGIYFFSFGTLYQEKSGNPVLQ
jgi:hypothetical protein